MSNTDYKPSSAESALHPTPAPALPTSARPSTGGRSAAEVWIAEAKIVECTDDET